MKTLITCLAICVLLVQTAAAQTNIAAAIRNDTIINKPNSFYIELLGASFLGLSANYERFLSKRPGGFSVKAGLGVGVIPGIFDEGYEVYGTLPLGLSYSLPVSKNRQHFIEAGGSLTFIFGTKEDNTQILSPIIGYRYQSPSGKFTLRATLFPLLFSSADDDGGGIPWAGVSLGTRF